MLIQAVRMAEMPKTPLPVPETADECSGEPRTMDPRDVVFASEFWASRREGMHDRDVARHLAAASTWAYADIDTFARQIVRHARLGAHETVGITDTNAALLLNTTVYVVQNRDRDIALLVFRGTGLQNFTDWLMDAGAHKDPFLTMGYVHGAWYRAMLQMWPTLRKILFYAVKGFPICDAAKRVKAEVECCSQDSCEPASLLQATVGPGAGRADQPAMIDRLPSPPTGKDPDRLKALYITGHSMGAALAVLTAAQLYVDSWAVSLRTKLRGVYTYGQPMVGDAEFAAHFQKEFGDKLFRHVYNRDIVPKLPPWTTGQFSHFGVELRPGRHGGWTTGNKVVRQAYTFLGSNLIGVFPLLFRELGRIPALEKFLPFSWADHLPVNYLRASETFLPGSEVGTR